MRVDVVQAADDDCHQIGKSSKVNLKLGRNHAPAPV